jgi:hypothetical protein
MAAAVCVKPNLAGINPATDPWPMCGAPATYQAPSVVGSQVTWCAEHAEADDWQHYGWIRINSPLAARYRAEYAALRARMEADAMNAPTYSTETMDLARAVLAYAREHYNDGGWDVIVECWDLQDICASLTKDPQPTTVDAAVDSFRGAVSVWKDRQDDARNSAF